MHYVYRRPTKICEETFNGKPVKYLVTTALENCELNNFLHNSSVVVGERVKIINEMTWTDTLRAIEEMDKACKEFKGEADDRDKRFPSLSQVRKLKRDKARLDAKLETLLMSLQDQPEVPEWRVSLPPHVVKVELAKPKAVLWEQEQTSYPSILEILRKLDLKANWIKLKVVLTGGKEHDPETLPLLDIFEGQLFDDEKEKDTVYKLNRSWLCFQKTFVENIADSWKDRIEEMWAGGLQDMLHQWDVTQLDMLYEEELRKKETQADQSIAKDGGKKTRKQEEKESRKGGKRRKGKDGGKETLKKGETRRQKEKKKGKNKKGKKKKGKKKQGEKKQGKEKKEKERKNLEAIYSRTYLDATLPIHQDQTVRVLFGDQIYPASTGRVELFDLLIVKQEAKGSEAYLIQVKRNAFTAKIGDALRQLRVASTVIEESFDHPQWRKGMRARKQTTPNKPGEKRKGTKKRKGEPSILYNWFEKLSTQDNASVTEWMQKANALATKHFPGGAAEFEDIMRKSKRHYVLAFVDESKNEHYMLENPMAFCTVIPAIELTAAAEEFKVAGHSLKLVQIRRGTAQPPNTQQVVTQVPPAQDLGTEMEELEDESPKVPLPLVP